MTARGIRRGLTCGNREDCERYGSSTGREYKFCRIKMDEAALCRMVGGPGVMREQIGRLLEARSQPNVTVQVIPFGAGSHPGMDGSFVVLDFPGELDQSIVYVESAAGGLFLEEEAEVRRYTLMYNHLRAAASGLDATASLLEAIRAEI